VERFDLANDAIEALEKLATDSYDVLLLDIDLDLSRSKLVDQLREHQSATMSTYHLSEREQRRSYRTTSPHALYLFHR
jgi:DNA-binding response OmpR family regulator